MRRQIAPLDSSYIIRYNFVYIYHYKRFTYTQSYGT
jgi:hypothetical protein